MRGRGAERLRLDPPAAWARSWIARARLRAGGATRRPSGWALALALRRLLGWPSSDWGGDELGWVEGED